MKLYFGIAMEQVSPLVTTHHHFGSYDQRCFHMEQATGSCLQKVLEERDLLSRGSHYMSLIETPFGPSTLYVALRKIIKEEKQEQKERCQSIQKMSLSIWERVNYEKGTQSIKPQKSRQKKQRF